jgi:SLT domain-containing protein
VWKPSEIGRRNGGRILAEFDNCGPGGKPVITIYQGGNRGTMAHELFHSEQYALHGKLGKNVRLSPDPDVRAAMEADVRIKLRAMGYEPRPNNARELVDNAGR